MTAHDVFLEAHLAEDGPRQRIGLVLLCSCGNLLAEIEASEPQMSLDLINEARFAHYDQDIQHTVPVCEICGESDE